MANAAAHGEQPGNFGLFDQRLAFLWVQKHIRGFHGDSRHVTAFGESAGSVSLACHMCSTVPLFNRVILQSGSPSTCTPMVDTARIERSYRELLQYCNISYDDPHRFEKLQRDVSADILVEAIGATGTHSFSPLGHESFFPVSPNYDNEAQLMSACPWVEQIVIGDCFDEVCHYHSRCHSNDNTEGGLLIHACPSKTILL